MGGRGAHSSINQHTPTETDRFIDRYHPTRRTIGGQEGLSFDRVPHDPTELKHLKEYATAHKPEILENLRQREAAAEKRRHTLANIPGLDEIREASRTYSQYMDERRRAINGDGTTAPPKEPFPLSHITKLRKKHSLAAAYLDAKKLTNSSNYELRTIGDHAIQLIANGGTARQARALMKREQDKYNKRHMWD